MKISVLRESGYDEALLGISLSYNAPIESMPQRALKLAHLGGGHSKFLESIMVWIDITASRKWWSQFDTYRMVTKQSESTMHTILKQPLTQEDFNSPIPEGWLEHLNQLIGDRKLEELKDLLPEGFLQRRIVCTSYKTLQNIHAQRHTHKLTEWHTFCEKIIHGVGHPEFIGKLDSVKIKDPHALIARGLYEAAKEVIEYASEAYSDVPMNTIPAWCWDLHLKVQLYEGLKENGVVE